MALGAGALSTWRGGAARRPRGASRRCALAAGRAGPLDISVGIRSAYPLGIRSAYLLGFCLASGREASARGVHTCCRAASGAAPPLAAHVVQEQICVCVCEVRQLFELCM